jgi:cell division cycle 14
MSVSHPHPHSVEIIESTRYLDKLYWTCTPVTSSESVHVFSTDHKFYYTPYYSDFGPIDLAQTHKFCTYVQSLLCCPEHESKSIIHLSSSNSRSKANSAYLMGAFCIIVLKKTAESTSALFSHITANFRDASESKPDFFLSLKDCFDGLEQAIRRGWFKFDEFSPKDYETLAKSENGDFSWIIPRQFLAFRAPCRSDTFIKKKSASIEQVCDSLKAVGIRTVIRLNKPGYVAEEMRKKGLKHYELRFRDGSVPSAEIVARFIDVCSSERGAIAVHCKAGLGRTGTLIGCYAVKIFKFPARAFIAWCRLCRPGSVLGPQQQFLVDYEDAVRNKRQMVLSVAEKNSGEKKQGTKLLFAKENTEIRIEITTDPNENVEETPEKVIKSEVNSYLCTPKAKRSRFSTSSGKTSDSETPYENIEDTPISESKSGDIPDFSAIKVKNPRLSANFAGLKFAKTLRNCRVLNVLYGRKPF